MVVGGLVNKMRKEFGLGIRRLGGFFVREIPRKCSCIAHMKITEECLSYIQEEVLPCWLSVYSFCLSMLGTHASLSPMQFVIIHTTDIDIFRTGTIDMDNMYKSTTPSPKPNPFFP